MFLSCPQVRDSTDRKQRCLKEIKATGPLGGDAPAVTTREEKE
jgi:hypothetical protein